MGFLTRAIVPYHVRHPARSAVHNADRRRRASNRRASKGLLADVMAWCDRPPQLVINLTTLAKEYEALFGKGPDPQTLMKPDSIAVEADSTDPWVVIVTADYQSLPDDDSAVEFWARTRVRFAPDGSWQAEGSDVFDEHPRTVVDESGQ